MMTITSLTPDLTVKSSGTKVTAGTSRERKTPQEKFRTTGRGGGGAGNPEQEDVAHSPAEEICSQEMVLQITSWRQKISSKLVDINHYTPDMFVKSQWQRTPGVSMYYLVYRWVTAVIFVCILISSAMGLGRPPGDFVYYLKWVVYLTHWGFTVCTVQAVFAAYLVTRARLKNHEDETEAMKMNYSLRIYWILHTVATIAAFSISTIYWGFVFNPDRHKVDLVNFLVHCGNSILMMTDLAVIAHPVRFIDFYYPAMFGIIYSLFNYLYFLAGGTSMKGKPYIYRILDWRKPLKPIINIICLTILVVFMHIVVSFISLLKFKIAHALRRKKAEEEDQTQESNKNEHL